ncbi:hypothetical protein [Paracoccus sediminis]|uniref:Uncharacterized protein n=1 Tax=Paracoccus sediminis TaxID=1214787 RepID=A0A238WZK9_9RHOB|nr:hypothetical protein [Paracoccus sediminis]SNR52017.1 hypothetical protein SAMN06265378_1071 [Paracoccus sediminis]
MIDLNDVGTPKARHDLAAVKDRLAATAGDWLPGIDSAPWRGVGAPTLGKVRA